MSDEKVVRNGRIALERLTVWAIIALLTGAWLWLRTDLSALVERQDRVFQMQSADHDDVVRLKEVVPRIEVELAAIKAQNSEILKELRARD